jgi:hypothetical protein
MTTSETREQAQLPESGTRNRLQKHAHTLLLISAIIVFSAFIVRDELRERAKELENSISSAQTFFATRQDIHIVMDQMKALDDLDTEILLLTYYSGDPMPQKITIGENRTRAQQVLGIGSYAGSFDASVDNIRHLLDELDPDPGDAKRINDLISRSTSVQKECADLSRGLDSTFDVSTYITHDFSRLTNEKISTIRDESLSVSKDIQALSTEVLIKAKHAEEDAKRRYKFVDWLSIGLVAAGLGVALVARLFGVDVFGGG